MPGREPHGHGTRRRDAWPPHRAGAGAGEPRAGGRQLHPRPRHRHGAERPGRGPRDSRGLRARGGGGQRVFDKRFARAPAGCGHRGGTGPGGPGDRARRGPADRQPDGPGRADRPGLHAPRAAAPAAPARAETGERLRRPDAGPGAVAAVAMCGWHACGGLSAGMAAAETAFLARPHAYATAA